MIHKLIARLLRRLANRLDRDGTHHYLGWNFTYPGSTIELHDQRTGHGCRLWYRSDEYHHAFEDGQQTTVVVE